MPFSLAPQEYSSTTVFSLTPREPCSGCSLLSHGIECIPHSCGGLENTELKEEDPGVPLQAVKCLVQ